MSKTAQEVKDELRARGMSISCRAREHGFAISGVNTVLRGQHQGLCGKAPSIKAALGMKDTSK